MPCHDWYEEVERKDEYRKEHPFKARMVAYAELATMAWENVCDWWNSRKGRENEMPCRDERFEWERNNVPQIQTAQLQDRCDELAQMLCWLMGTLEHAVQEFDIVGNPKLIQWWADHQKADTGRVTTEMKVQVNRFQSPELMAYWFINRAKECHAVSEFHKEWFHRLAKEAFAERETVEEAK